MKSIIAYLLSQAKQRQAEGHTYKPFGLELAQDIDIHLATLMQNVEDAKRELDTYIFTRVEDAHKGDVR